MYVQKENTLHVSQDVVSVGSGEEKRGEGRTGSLYGQVKLGCLRV